MCGIVGCAGKISAKHERAFKNMLVLDTLRGVDSTGAIIVHRNGEHSVSKALGHAFNLLESRAFEKSMLGFHTAMIGHNRWATQGKVSVRNAHPFEFDKVIGVHNGTLKNKHVLKDGYKFDVDSEALYSHINNEGVEDAIKNLDGAWALVWINLEENSLNFLRNKERPLFMSVAKEGQLFWASEPWMIEVAMDREDLEYTEPVLLPEDQWHRIQLHDDGSLGKPHVVPLASRFQPYVWPGNQATTRPQQQQTAVSQATQATGSTTQTSIESNAAAVIDTTRVNSEITPYVYPRGSSVRLHVIGKGSDSQGGSYYICRDAAAPDRNIRLFINQTDRVELLNKYIFAEIHQFTVRDRYGLYYKVQHSTVKLADSSARKDTKIDVTKEVVEAEQASADRFFHDAHGRLISQHEWNKKHGTCDWCQGHVNPNLAFRFTTSGDTICHECAADSEVSKYVNLC